MCNTQCEFCANLMVTPGGHVPYGSTTAQLPDDWDCVGEFPATPTLPEQLKLEFHINKQFQGQCVDCPAFVPREMGQCPKHGDYPVNEPCWKCLDEQMGEPSDA